MNNIVNRVQLTGNIGNKPKIVTFDDGNKVANFSMATNEEYTTRKGEKVTDTQWHNISVKGKLVKRIETELDKGSYISVEGRLTTRNYTDKNGQKRYITEIIASDLVVNQKNEA
jgi:single-strand DNA-binding protein